MTCFVTQDYTHATAGPPLDTTLLDMCRSLEEENGALVRALEDLRGQLATAQQAADSNKLIPHYRLAIIRYRYAQVCSSWS